MKYTLLEIIGVIASFLAIVKILIVTYNKFSRKTLLYQIRSYKLQKDKHINVLCIWNPTYKDVIDTDVSEQLSLGSSYDTTNSFLINTTDGNLANIIQIIDNNEKYSRTSEIQIKFKKFPARSGAIFSIKSSNQLSRIKGKIKGNELRKFTMKSDFFDFLKFTSIILALSMPSFLVKEGLLFAILITLIIFLLIRFIIEIIERLIFSYKDKPAVMRHYWEGNPDD